MFFALSMRWMKRRTDSKLPRESTHNVAYVRRSPMFRVASMVPCVALSIRQSGILVTLLELPSLRCPSCFALSAVCAGRSVVRALVGRRRVSQFL